MVGVRQDVSTYIINMPNSEIIVNIRDKGCVEFNKVPSDIHYCKTLASVKYKVFKHIMYSV